MCFYAKVCSIWSYIFGQILQQDNILFTAGFSESYLDLGYISVHRKYK